MTIPPPAARPPMPATSPAGRPPGASAVKAVDARPPYRAPPFLLWPVSRREFYRSIWIGMLPAFAWAVVIFGVRALAMLVASVCAATAIHLLLKRVLPWERGKSLAFAHTLVSVMVLVALSHPLWPVWVVVCMALLVPLILAVLGGPGKERVHVAVVLMLAIQYAVVPVLVGHTYAGGVGGEGRGSAAGGNAILARDRLVMGDVREQQTGSVYHWPSSRELGGSDAVRVPLPARVAVDVLNELSRRMAQGRGEALAMGLSRQDEAELRAVLEPAFAFRLPGMDAQIAGAVAGRIGTVSFIGIALAGLYLAYRYILRPRSVVVFLAAFFLGSLALAFWPSAIARVGMFGLWNILTTFPGEIGTLFNILVLSSDAFFAAVIILALPGTEPLTSRGRRVFLILAGVFAALLHRLEPTVPAATVSLCALMPLTYLFDKLFARRSWLNAPG